MTLLTSIVDLDCIQVNFGKGGFDPKSKAAEIEALAYSISELEGLVRIPVVKSLGIDQYELIDGYLEYCSYLEARRLNSDLPNRITVFVMKSSNEKEISKQLDINRQVAQVVLPSTSEKGTDGILALRVGTLESKLSEGFHHIELKFEAIKAESLLIKDELLALVDSKLPRLLPPLEAFNRILEEPVRQKVHKKIADLRNKKLANRIVDSLQQYRKNGHEFTSFEDVLNCLDKGTLSSQKMLELIDRWQD
jgi:hypothetical protein